VTAPDPDASRRTLLLYAALLAPYAFLVDRFWYVCDDAFISFRYASNWAAGEGLRYNLWDAAPVEGYSNFLWTAVSAALLKLGAAPEVFTPLLSALCGALLLWRVLRALRVELGLPVAAAAAAGASLALSPSFAVWSTSGLETMPHALLVFLAFEQLFLRDGTRAAWLGSTALLGVALIRVEGFALAGAMATMAAATRWGRPAALRALAPGLTVASAAFAAYFAIRWSYYGEPLSNTVTAKVGFSTDVAARGLKYAATALLVLLAPALGVLGLLPAWRTLGWRVGGPLVALVGALFVWPVLAGGDFMPFSRLYVAALPLVALLLGLAARRPALAGLTLLLAAGGAASAWDVYPVPASVRNEVGFRDQFGKITEWKMWWHEQDQVGPLSRLGQALAANSLPGESVVMGAMGAEGYYSGLNVYDRYGLVTPDVARMEAADLRLPGHDKRVEHWHFVDDRPTYLFANLMVDPRASRAFAQDLQRRGLAEIYAPELVPVGVLVEGGVPLWLLRFRLISGEAGVAWERYRGVVRGYEAGL